MHMQHSGGTTVGTSVDDTHTSITSDSTFKHVLRVVLAIIFLNTSRVTTFQLMFLFYYCTNVIITSLIRSTCTPEGNSNAIIMKFLVAGCVNNPTSAFMVGLGRLNGLLVT